MVVVLVNAHPVDMTCMIAPETELERELLDNPRLRAGLDWGHPRSGHPEGRVAGHVATMLAAIPNDDELRPDLRFIALIHDSFKAEVRPDEPWSPDNDHAVLARRFAERYTADERLLTTLELHDEPYWIWHTAATADPSLQPLLERVTDSELFARFIELDAATEGKDLTFLWWFRRELAQVGQLPRHAAAHADGPNEDVVYIKAFATTPQQQAAVARAADALVAEQQHRMDAHGHVLISDDGLRVVLQWSWHGSRRELIERDEEVVRDGLAAHPILGRVRPVEARIFHLSRRG
jgi:hypothetical protein